MRELPDRDVEKDWPNDHRSIAQEYHDPTCRACPSDSAVQGWDNLHVHHRNGDKSDNHPKNLLPVCPECHGKIHGGSGSGTHKSFWRELPDSAQTGTATRTREREIAYDQWKRYENLGATVNHYRDQANLPRLKPWEVEEQVCRFVEQLLDDPLCPLTSKTVEVSDRVTLTQGANGKLRVELSV